MFDFSILEKSPKLYGETKEEISVKSKYRHQIHLALLILLH